ncbi:N-acetyl-gamma-glutamyl-phosphate reductase [Corynebacterium anserum]|uniref:N-acetyl-gamma-glutamyl-phosphate reductase n=1 Tax=Corynebacterium anserum TaxID=2684406 RepID=A0A7G7YN64_9CORY|nr:N-acetyl-gamma-glutamyl-phosphate reductase [Corynebacterium anserum]MBC2680826.1 N-acetyl-gamma-glutamyl-phosphate reductase [Corynebacterium anserum]QNH95934.1 N-acetyl-gamma-glutamyl-phosphate reductase [Corynebacterium anserum]
MLKIAVAGASGYAGSEALRLLLAHPGYGKDFEIGSLTGGSNAGNRFGDLVPHLPQLADRVLEDTTRDILVQNDAAILGLPHGVSAALDLPENMYVVDCGADYRLKNESDWDRYYGSEYAGHHTYGIPELPGNRDLIKKSRYIAAPGCFPTGATLAAVPGIAAGLIAPQISVVSVTGVSGAGKKPAVSLLGAETMENARAYNVGKHRHTPEIRQNLQAVVPDNEDVYVTFTPVLAPMKRGILTTVTAPARGSIQDIRKAYEDFCAAEPFLLLLPEGQQPETQSVRGSNMTHIQVEEVDGMVVVTSAIDNLTKGTAGAAVQCLNLMLGWDETAGLPQTGV